MELEYIVPFANDHKRQMKHIFYVGLRSDFLNRLLIDEKQTDKTLPIENINLPYYRLYSLRKTIDFKTLDYTKYTPEKIEVTESGIQGLDKDLLLWIIKITYWEINIQEIYQTKQPIEARRNAIKRLFGIREQIIETGLDFIGPVTILRIIDFIDTQGIEKVLYAYNYKMNFYRLSINFCFKNIEVEIHANDAIELNDLATECEVYKQENLITEDIMPVTIEEDNIKFEVLPDAAKDFN